MLKSAFLSYDNHYICIYMKGLPLWFLIVVFVKNK